MFAPLQSSLMKVFLVWKTHFVCLYMLVSLLKDVNAKSKLLSFTPSSLKVPTLVAVSIRKSSAP